MDDSGTTVLSRRFGLRLTAILVLALPLMSPAQDAPRAARVRALTGQLTEIGSETKRVSPSEIRKRNSNLIRERGEMLHDLLAENPSEAVKLSFQPEVAERLRAEFPEASENIESEANLESPLIVYVGDMSSGTSRTTMQIEQRQRKLDVYFAMSAPEGAKSGDVLRIRGIRIRDRVAAIEATVVNAATGVLACSPIGDQKTAVLLVNFPGTPVPAVTTDTLRSVFFSATQRSVDGFWRENSYS